MFNMYWKTNYNGQMLEFSKLSTGNYVTMTIDGSETEGFTNYTSQSDYERFIKACQNRIEYMTLQGLI